MRPSTSMTIAALVAVAVAGAAVAPANAQDWPVREWRFHLPDLGPHMFFHHGPRVPHDRLFAHRGNAPRHMARDGNLIALVCADSGAERLERTLLNLERRIDLTDDQKALFDEFRAAALIAQTNFADACGAPRKAARSDDSDLADRLKARLDIQKARVAAMSEVLPSFEAFYDSLSAEQKRALEPRRLREGLLERRFGADASPDRT